MAKASPSSVVFHAAFEREFLPLLKQLRFEPNKVKRVRPGLVVAAATRPLGPERRVEATLWYGPNGAAPLRFRLDVVGPINGLECTQQVDLKVPWPDASTPNPVSVDASGNDFLPHQNDQRLETAIRFLAGAFAASLPTAAEMTELREDIDHAAASPEWTAAVVQAKQLWEMSARSRRAGTPAAPRS
jgi:hypothetical protein